MQHAQHEHPQEAPADWLDKAGVHQAAALLGTQCHEAALRAGWWHDLFTGADLRSAPGEKPRCNVPELLCLIHSEVSEALDGFRTGSPDECLPDRPALEVELADAVMRIFSLGAGIGLDLPGAIADKLDYNTHRSDHTREARLAAGGKKF
ncbi:hypothetical protein AB7849_09425 [Rhodanobacter sp. 115]|uniref:hypothetical protein n=1 Tax=Rhodanobacter sp. FW021-MT20 TaxID=1162282 RepID=UPI0034E390E2